MAAPTLLEMLSTARITDEPTLADRIADVLRDAPPEGLKASDIVRRLNHAAGKFGVTKRDVNRLLYDPTVKAALVNDPALNSAPRWRAPFGVWREPQAATPPVAWPKPFDPPMIVLPSLEDRIADMLRRAPAEGVTTRDIQAGLGRGGTNYSPVSLSVIDGLLNRELRNRTAKTVEPSSASADGLRIAYRWREPPYHGTVPAVRAPSVPQRHAHLFIDLATMPSLLRQVWPYVDDRLVVSGFANAELNVEGARTPPVAGDPYAGNPNYALERVEHGMREGVLLCMTWNAARLRLRSDAYEPCTHMTLVIASTNLAVETVAAMARGRNMSATRLDTPDKVVAWARTFQESLPTRQ